MYLGDRPSNTYTARKVQAQDSSGKKLLLYLSTIDGKAMCRSIKCSLEICLKTCKGNAGFIQSSYTKGCFWYFPLQKQTISWTDMIFCACLNSLNEKYFCLSCSPIALLTMDSGQKMPP